MLLDLKSKLGKRKDIFEIIVSTSKFPSKSEQNYGLVQKFNSIN